MKDYLHDEAEKMSREEFIEKHGESLAGFWDSINGTEEAVEGKLPAGLQAYQDKKAGKEEKKEVIEEANQIYDVKDVIPTIYLVSELSRNKI